MADLPLGGTGAASSPRMAAVVIDSDDDARHLASVLTLNRKVRRRRLRASPRPLRASATPVSIRSSSSRACERSFGPSPTKT